MTAALKWDLISVDDYLAGELVSQIKHEYVGGVVHAMARARVSHNDITMNTLLAIGGRLRGKRCKPYGSDMKIRVDLGSHVCFYYPDISVICESNPKSDSYQDRPTAIVEVHSKSTRRIDTGEKKEAYLKIPSLRAYALIEQEMPLVVVFRRVGGDFVRELYEGLDAVVPLPEIELELPLSEIYAGVEFTPEPDEDEA